MLRRLLVLLAALTAAGTIISVAPAQAVIHRARAGDAVAAPFCGIYWGSLAKSHPSSATAPLTNLRAGRHDCFDRLVFDIRGRADGYHVAYVPQVTADGSGAVVPLRGGARLQIIVVAPAYDASYRPVYRPTDRAELVNVSGWRTFRQVAWAGSFEGQTTVGLGVRARLPFRVFTLAGPGTGSRIVVDVAHRW
ncbi:MAG TPA: hypothetical protein VI011_23150 [Asanoa sp.]